MGIKSIIINQKPYWFLGAAYFTRDKKRATEDQTPRFVKKGIWENGYENRYFDKVNSIGKGELAAIKSVYTRKKGLPFDNKGQVISVMAIKAVGEVTNNLGDGHHIEVAWQRIEPPREWYFFTYRRTVWRIMPTEWRKIALIDFTFNGKDQDLERFLQEYLQ